MSEKEFFKYSRNVFKIFRVWSKDDKIRSSRFTVVVFLGCIIPAICASETIIATMTGDIQQSITKALYGLAYIVSFHKVIVSVVFAKEINVCIRQLELMSLSFRDLTDFDGSLRVYKRMSIVGLVSMNLCGVLFLSAPTVVREFPYNPHVPYLDFTKSPFYEIMYAYQTMAVLTLTNLMLAYDTLFCGLMSLCGGVFASITREVGKIEFDIDPPQHPDILLKDAIKKLDKISHITNDVSKIFSYSTMTSILYNCCLMALGLFSISILPFGDLRFITMFVITVVQFFQLWIYCYFGQVIVNQKQLVAMELYCSKWYNGSKRFQSMFLFTLFEAQKERYIKAGNVLPLSLRTFTEVVKKAYAFYAFMSKTS